MILQKKKTPIYNINPESEEINKLIELQGLLNDRKFKRVIQECSAARKKYPNNFFFYTIGSIALSMIGKEEESFNLMLETVKKFPDEYEVRFQLAKVYEDFEDYESAEVEYKKSYDLTPREYADTRSDCLNDLGVIYWKTRRKEEALEQWKLALIEDPKNIKAQNNYRKFSNEYGEPLAVSSLMDDIFRFQNLQTKKYLADKGKNEFSNDEEAKKIIGIIMDAWNKNIAPQKEKLDSYNPAQKTDWFNSVALDFENQTSLTETMEYDNNKLLPYLEDYDIYSIYDCVDENDLIILPFTFPLLRAVGIKEERLDDLFDKKDEPTDYEEYIIEWAVEIGSAVGDGVIEEKEKGKTELYQIALTIAKEELNEKEADSAITDLKNLFRKAIDESEKLEKKKSKKNRKKKH